VSSELGHVAASGLVSDPGHAAELGGDPGGELGLCSGYEARKRVFEFGSGGKSRSGSLLAVSAGNTRSGSPFDPVPISDAEWREIQLGWEESDDSDIDDEDGDLYLEEWDDY